MPGDAWLTIVIGASGVVAIVAVALVVRVVRPSGGPAVPPRSSRSRSDLTVPPPAQTVRTGGRGWGLRSFGPWHHHHSVEHNLHRAFARIDAVDPYAMPRRIGSALAEAGLVSETPDERRAERPRTAWPFGPVRDSQQRKDDE